MLKFVDTQFIYLTLHRTHNILCVETVSWPDDSGEIKEAPIPEQFMHKLVNGSVTSQVSDLYH